MPPLQPLRIAMIIITLYCNRYSVVSVLIDLEILKGRPLLSPPMPLHSNCSPNLCNLEGHNEQLPADTPQLQGRACLRMQTAEDVKQKMEENKDFKRAGTVWCICFLINIKMTSRKILPSSFLFKFLRNNNVNNHWKTSWLKEHRLSDNCVLVCTCLFSVYFFIFFGWCQR